jgi:hypothetical protein
MNSSSEVSSALTSLSSEARLTMGTVDLIMGSISIQKKMDLEETEKMANDTINTTFHISRDKKPDVSHLYISIKSSVMWRKENNNFSKMFFSLATATTEDTDEGEHRQSSVCLCL